MNALTRPLPTRVHAQPGHRLPEGKVTTLAGYDLIALGATKPLIRPHEPALQQRRHDLLKRALADNARATQSVVTLLTHYPPSPSASENSVAGRLQFILERGVVILRRQQPQARDWPYLDTPPRAAWNVPCALADHLSICAASDHKLTEAGARFLFILEAGWPGSSWRNVAFHPSWPAGDSGVTLGAGYDMGSPRTPQSVARDLTNAGLNPALAQKIGQKLSTVRASKAREALAQNPDLAKEKVLNNDTAWKLMLNTMGDYERHTARQLPPSARNRLFGYEFDALAVAVFQAWALSAGVLGPLGLGNLDKVTFRPRTGRANAELRLFRAGQYDSAELYAA